MNTQITAAGNLSPQQVLEDVIISIIVDASGSMKIVRDETRKAVNEYIGELQSGTPVTFSFGTFNNDIIWKVAEQPVDSVKPLAIRDYDPDGRTRLYDAIGESIQRIEMMDIPPVHPIVVVFTDGEDLGSRNYDAETLKPMIDERRARGWRFIAFVIGKTAKISTTTAGFLPEDTAEYSADGKSTQTAFKKLAASTKRLVNAVEKRALPPARFLD